MLNAAQYNALKKKKSPIKNKYGAKKSTYNNLSFPSKLEKNVYIVLEKLKAKGVIDFFLRQVPFDLPGKTTHRVDYMTIDTMGYKLFEAKGRDLPMGKMKRAQTEELYGVSIHVITSPSQVLTHFTLTAFDSIEIHNALNANE